MILYVGPLVVRSVAALIRLRSLFLLAAAFIVLAAQAALAAPVTTTYQAKIIKPDGQPLESIGVAFRFTVLDPAGACILYSESYSAINMNGSGGLVYFSLGSGTATYTASGTQTFVKVFNNNAASFTCAPGGPVSYTPMPTDVRKIVMQFNDGAGWQTLPAMAINAVPYAMYADSADDATKLNGKTDSDFIEKVNVPTCAADRMLYFNGATFSCVTYAAGSGGGIASLSVTGPISSTGGATPALSIAQANSTTDGYLSSTDWNIFNNKITSSAASIAQVLGYVPASAGTVTNLQSSLGALAYANSVDLGSASATGIIADARLANQSGVVSGTPYTKVTVDGKGRVIAGAQLTSSDVTTALGYAPASASASSQWNTSGTTINYMNGNVGIGTDAPAGQLDIRSPSSGATTDPIDNPTIWVAANCSLGSSLISSEECLCPAGYTLVDSSANGIFDPQECVSNNNIVTLSNGRIGIGTSSPLAALHIKDAGGIFISPRAQNDYNSNPAAGVNGGTFLSIADIYGIPSDGKFIGLEVSSMNSGGYNQSSYFGSVSINGGTTPETVLGQRSGGAKLERIRIARSGNVGIGTTTPIAKLDVSGGIRISMQVATCTVSYAGTLRYNAGTVEFCNGTTWAAFGVSGAGITSLNGLTSGTQTFANGTSGNSPAFVSANGVHTLNIPLASVGTTTAGLISNTDYVNFNNKITSSSAAISQVLGYTPASAGAVTNLQSSLGALAYANSVDLGSASATGIIADARLANQSGITSGTEYTKVTVDGKGRVIAGAQLALSDVTTALGYTPASASVASQWNTSGTTINYMNGNVGIGTSAPTSLLTVNGDALINGMTVGVGPNNNFANTGVGYQVLSGTTTGFSNSAFGHQAMMSNTTGYYNVAFGRAALANNQTGNENTAVGTSALQNSTAGRNVAVGYRAMMNAVSGSNNTALGTFAGNGLTSGTGNTLIGTGAQGGSTGSYNTSLGYLAGSAITSGSKNTIIGSFTGNNGGLDIRTSNNFIVLSDGDGNPRQVIDSVGNVGIGTTTPVTKLSVSGGLQISMESAACAIGYAGTLRYNAGSVEFCNGSTWSAFGVSGAGITSFNGSTSATQSLATGVAGNAPNFVTANGVHTLNIPYASVGTTTAGLISNADYVNFNNKITSSSAAIAQVLGYTPVSAGAVTNLQASLGALAYGNSVDLGSASATGIIADARLANQTGVTSGTSYTKVTVDGKGRVIAGAQLASSDVTTALGYTPVSAVAASQWNTSGTTINYMAGNVGIGTINPAYKLDVNGTIRSTNTDTTGTSLLVLGESQGAGTPFFIRRWGSANALFANATDIWNENNGFMRFATNNEERLRITSTGKVGIGTDAPTSKLHIVDSSAAVFAYNKILSVHSAGLVPGDTSQIAWGTSDSAYNQAELNFYNAGSGSTANQLRLGVHTVPSILVLQANGNVGVGTTTPVTRLSVSGGVQIGAESAACAVGYAGTIRYNAGNVEFCNGTTWSAFGVAGSGLTSLNGSTSATQTFTYSASGVAPVFTTANGVHTLNIPLASATGAVSAGLISNADYVSFKNKMNATSAAVISALGYTPVSAGAASQWNTSGTTINYMAGNVGIGTTNPQGKLDVNGTVYAGSLSAVGNSPYYSANGGVGIVGYPSGSYGLIQSYANAGGTPRDLVINGAGGNVGVGTTNPNARLEVLATGGESVLLGGGNITRSEVKLTYPGLAHFSMYNNGKFTIANTSSNIATNIAGTALMTLDTAGNLGIGTTNPSAKLSVTTTAGTSSAVFTDGTNSTLTIAHSSPGNLLRLIGNGSSQFTFENNSTERMRIDNAGNVGIGTTVPSKKLTIQTPATGSWSTASQLRLEESTGNGFDLWGGSNLNFGTSGTTMMTITSLGNVGIGTTTPSEKLEVSGSVKATSFISTSDRRLKTNIAPSAGLSLITQLQGVRYNWISNGGEEYGVIAQEIEKVLPSAVVTDKQSGFKAVKYQNLIAPLIESTKELYGQCQMSKKQMQQVERRLASVESEVEKLKKENADLRKNNELLNKKLDIILKKLNAD